MRSCPRCGSGSLVSRGTEGYTALAIEGGRIVERDGLSQRFTCRDCGRTSSHRDPSLEQASHQAHALVVDTAHRMGQTAAAACLGLARATVQRHMARWRDAREEEVAGAAPAFLLLDVAHLRRADRILVVDLDRETLVEMLEGHGALAGWLSNGARAPAVKVCLGVDPRIASIVRESLPTARLMVAPTTMRRIVRGEAILATRTLRRAPAARGRNGMPFPAEMAQALSGLSPVPEQWPMDAGAILTGARAAMHLLSLRGRDEAEAAWPQFELAVAMAPMPRLGRLFSTWREPILDGIDHRFVDRAADLAAAARRALSTRRPSLGFQDLRGYALMDGFETVVEGLPIPGVVPTPVSVGRPLAGLVEAMRS